VCYWTDLVVLVNAQLKKWTTRHITSLPSTFGAGHSVFCPRQSLCGELVESGEQPLRMSDQFHVIAEFAREAETLRDALNLRFACERALD
jgi:hypothetical protein